METVVEFLELYHIEVIACTIFLSLLSLIAIIINSIKTKKVMRRYNELMRGVDSENLESTLKLYMNNVEGILNNVKKIELSCDELSSQIQTCIQNVDIMRYNAFDDVGSNQSYSIALLDNENNGVVLTGLFGRDSSTTYAKPIRGGKSSYPLTGEEEEVIAKAMR